MHQFSFKKSRRSNGDWKSVFTWGVIGLSLFLLGVNGVIYKVQYDKQFRIQQQLAEKVLRFHVLANSNSEKDQALKICVRDAIGEYMQEQLEGEMDKEASKERIAAHLVDIEAIAEEIVAQEGCSYEVTAQLTQCDFPVKTYGAYTFPAGEYEALQVVIGEGAGENWWCVLYPNMCFENSVYEVVDENAKEALRKVLNQEEYEAVLSSGNYEIRFRFLEWFR